MTTHKIHLKCSVCGKALHRSMRVRSQIRSGPQIYCRNKTCKMFGKKQIMSSMEVVVNETIEKENGLNSIVKNHDLENRDVIKLEQKEKKTKIEEIRQNIQEMLNFNTVEVQTFLTTLVVIAQEIGEVRFSKKLIKRFKLEKYFDK